MATDNTAADTIVEAFFEGGSLTMIGIRTDNAWRFKIATDEGTIWDLLSDEDRGSSTPANFRHDSEWVDSWDDALAMLSERRYWHMSCAQRVHPEFSERIWTAVQESAAGDESRADAGWARWVRMQLERWERVCRGEPPFPVDELRIEFR
jgi:hypothetical protein